MNKANKENLSNVIKKITRDYANKISNFSTEYFLKTDIDPFRFEFNTKIWGLENAVKREIAHKAEMYLEYLFGNFHEDYLANATDEKTGSKWKKADRRTLPGIDIINEKKECYLQIKNKHNSLNSSSADNLAKKLEAISKQKKNSIVGCGWVIAGPSRTCNGEDLMKKGGMGVYKGKKLYEFVTGNPQELDQVLKSFPIIVEEELKKYTLKRLLDDALIKILKDLKKLAKDENVTVMEYLYRKAAG